MLGNTEADQCNAILRNVTIAVPLKHIQVLWDYFKYHLLLEN